MPKLKAYKPLLPALGFVLMLQPIAWLPNMAQAEEFTHFISDNIQVPLRRGAGTEYRIERMLDAGSPIKVLEVGDSSWSRVEYRANGRSYTGWVSKVAIQNERPANIRLKEMTAQYEKLEARLKQLQREHDTLKQQTDSANQELSQLKQEKFEFNKEYEYLQSISGNAIELDTQNREMRKTISDLESQNVIMREQIAQAEDTVKRQWFLTGAGVLLLGLIIGRFFRIPKRNSSWDKI